MNRAERVIWAAGFFDGEAFIGISRGITASTQRPCHQVLLDVAQKNREVLDVLVDLFGGKVRVGKNWCGPIYCWRLNGQHAYRALAEVQPYLIGKRRQAELAIEFGQTLVGRQGQRISDDTLARREAIHTELRVLNRRRRPTQAERLSEEAPQEDNLRMVR